MEPGVLQQQWGNQALCITSLQMPMMLLALAVSAT